MEFAILVAKRGENFIVLYEGEYEQVVEINERLTDKDSEDNTTAFVVKIDEKAYREKRQYLEIFNEYIESSIESNK